MTTIACSISLHECLRCSKGCKQAHFYCSQVQRLLKRGIRGARNTFYALQPSWEHALALILARYQQFWSFWSLLTPFSAFDGLDHVVNLDEAESLWRYLILIRTDERGVTINQGRLAFCASPMSAGGNTMHHRNYMQHFIARTPGVLRREQTGTLLSFTSARAS